MTDATWEGVRARLRALAERPLDDRAFDNGVFGALGHRFRLDDPLTPEGLADLEARTGVSLPEEYRGFLLHVGAGGAGPAYGVFPVLCEHGTWRWVGDGADLADLARLAEPFPRRGPDPARLEALLAERPDEEELDDGDDFDAALEEWSDRWEALMWSADRTVGAVPICHLGCATRQWLVLTGPERGRIWADNRVDEVDLEPLLDADGEPVTFTWWYLGWLEAAERELSLT
ncbi:SMI1/KNR4 family protein [Streptodolium elevatio]|uniref:SMI1/KNR4 family protein n=1 Tax=Streptodolium elevatio TaxID=3157996 RepID=A0ABV3DJA6_9ACTN